MIPSIEGFEMRMVRWIASCGLRPHWAAANCCSCDSGDGDENDYRPLDVRLIAPRLFKYPTIQQLIDERRQQAAEDARQQAAADMLRLRRPSEIFDLSVKLQCARDLQRSAEASRLGLV